MLNSVRRDDWPMHRSRPNCCASERDIRWHWLAPVCVNRRVFIWSSCWSSRNRCTVARMPLLCSVGALGAHLALCYISVWPSYACVCGCVLHRAGVLAASQPASPGPRPAEASWHSGSQGARLKCRLGLAGAGTCRPAEGCQGRFTGRVASGRGIRGRSRQRAEERQDTGRHCHQGP